MKNHYHQQAVRAFAAGSKDPEIVREAHNAKPFVSNHGLKADGTSAKENQMKKVLNIVLAATLLLAASAFSQVVLPMPQQGSNPQSNTYPAIEYGQWTGQIITGNTATGSQTILVYSSGIFPGNRNSGVNPFAYAAPVAFNGETLTPTAVPSCGQSRPAGLAAPEGGYLCNITATFANLHGAGEIVRSGDGGILEASFDAYANGGGEVTIDRSTQAVIPTVLTASGLPLFGNVYFKDTTAPQVQYWNLQQTASTFIAVPTTLTSSTVGFGINGANTTGGTYTGTSTYHVCVSYVDVAGQEGQCSADFSGLTAGTGSTNQIGVAAPAASTGAVGYTVYISLASGTYSLAYQVPLTSTVCTLTKIETVTPACAVTNSTYGQTGSNAVVSALTVNTSPVDMQKGGVSGTLLTGNPNGRTTYGYVPSAHVAALGIPTVSFAFTAGGIGSATPIAIGTVNLPATVMNYAGKTIRVCGKFLNTDVNSSIQNINIYWDAAGSDSTGSPVQIGGLAATGTGTAAAYEGSFCETFSTTVSGAGVTAGSIIPSFGNLQYALVSSGNIVGNGADTIAAATASLNLAGGAGFGTRLSIVHTNTTGNATPQLQSLTIEVL